MLLICYSSIVPAYHPRCAHPSGTDYRGKELICVEVDDAEGHCDEELANDGNSSNEPLVTLGNGHDAQQGKSCKDTSVKHMQLLTGNL